MSRLLIRIARLKVSQIIVGWIFTYMSFVIPVKRLRETNTLMAFHHPQPSYRLHILLVPKRPYPTLLSLPTDDTTFLKELIETVQSLVLEFNLQNDGYRLITNGGIYQDVPHLHFHLISGEVQETSLKTEQ
jgi:histidine triad (HIT) family protein